MKKRTQDAPSALVTQEITRLYNYNIDLYIYIIYNIYILITR